MERRCNIGQWSRCAKNGCEWAQKFGHSCEVIHISKRKELGDPLRDAMDALEKKSIPVLHFPEANEKIIFCKTLKPRQNKKKKKKKNNLAATAISNILERKKTAPIPFSTE